MYKMETPEPFEFFLAERAWGYINQYFLQVTGFHFTFFTYKKENKEPFLFFIGRALYWSM